MRRLIPVLLALLVLPAAAQDDDLNGRAVDNATVTLFATVEGARGLTYDPFSDTLFTLHRDEGTLFAIDAEGETSVIAELLPFHSGYVGPYYDPVSEHLYVSQYAAHDPGKGTVVWQIALDGDMREFAYLSAPSGIAGDSDGNLYISSYNCPGSVVQIAPDGESSVYREDLCNPDGLVWHEEQDVLYIGDRGSDRILGGDMEADLAEGLALAVDSAGTLYAADYAPGTLVTIDASGNVTTIGRNFVEPDGLAFNNDGDLFIAELGGGIYRVEF